MRKSKGVLRSQVLMTT